MALFIDYLPMEEYQQIVEEREKETGKAIDYISHPHVDDKRRLKAKVRSGNDVKLKQKFYPEELDFNPYIEPRKCAEWIHKIAGGDCWAYMFEFGGNPPFRKIFRGIIKKEDEEYIIKYFCKDEHKAEEEQEYDGKIIDMSKPDKNYRKFAGL